MDKHTGSSAHTRTRLDTSVNLRQRTSNKYVKQLGDRQQERLHELSNNIKSKPCELLLHQVTWTDTYICLCWGGDGLSIASRQEALLQTSKATTQSNSIFTHVACVTILGNRQGITPGVPWPFVRHQIEHLHHRFAFTSTGRHTQFTTRTKCFRSSHRTLGNKEGTDVALEKFRAA